MPQYHPSVLPSEISAPPIAIGDLIRSSLEQNGIARPITQKSKSRKSKERQAAISERIFEEDCSVRDAVGFCPRMFALVNLPHRKQKSDLEVWERVNGKASITIQPGIRRNQQGITERLDYPYGIWPRLLIYFLVSEAKRLKTGKIKLGSCMANVFERLKIPHDTRSVRMARTQAELLFSASIHFRYENGDGLYGKPLTLVDEYLLWGSELDPSKWTKSPSIVVLSEKFLEEIQEHSFPIDMDAIRALRQSPLALDLYTWLAHRVRRLKRPVTLSYEMLQEQIGSEYEQTNEFGRHVREMLQRIHCFWRALEFKTVSGGVTFFPSAPPVQEISTSA